jgi:hypothetical protein
MKFIIGLMVGGSHGRHINSYSLPKIKRIIGVVSSVRVSITSVMKFHPFFQKLLGRRRAEEQIGV